MTVVDPARWARRARELLGRAVVAARGSDVLDLVLPRECGGCLRAGEEWCGRCARALDALAFVAPAARGAPSPGRTRTAAVEPDGAPGVAPRVASPASGGGAPRAIGGAPWVVPHRAPGGMPPVHAWGIYADPLRAVVSAWKDGGRRDLARLLEPVLTSSIAGALDGVGWVEGVVLVVPAPSSRRAERQRGDTPIVELCRAAAAAVGRTEQVGSGAGAGVVIRVAPALHHVRRVEDQSGLGTAARRVNLRGALEVNPLWLNVVRDRRCLLVDDVVTTGATLAEAARALREAGAGPVAGAAIAATQRTRG
ncbi:ComF family protein [Terrabacter terrigena]|uniref:ComF family protein n=1 Tax=Terrabacter terrigena TaxID=574718 RepID=A0ABW3MR91_9MICO